MRLLFVTPELPSPPASGGTARVHGLASHLARRHSVAVLAYRQSGPGDLDRVRATGRYASLVVTVENRSLGAPAATKRRAQLRSLASRGSYERLIYRTPSFQRALERVCKVWQPDAIVVEFAQMGSFDFPPGIPIILDAHNVEHQLVERMAAIEGSLARRLYGAINRPKLRREELRIARRADAVAVTSAVDRATFEEILPGLHPTVIPNGVDCQAFGPDDGDQRQQAQLVFFGALDYLPNADAVLFFHREIWPGLKQQNPDLEWLIIGRLPPPAVQALGDEPGISVTGFVDELAATLASATIVVVPLRAGSGTRLKVLEALAMGKPVVSTSAGIEGLKVVSGRHLLVAGGPAMFALAVQSLLDNPDQRRKLGEQGRALVLDQYDWPAIAVRFEALILSTLPAEMSK